MDLWHQSDVLKNYQAYINAMFNMNSFSHLDVGSSLTTEWYKNFLLNKFLFISQPNENQNVILDSANGWRKYIANKINGMWVKYKSL